MFPKTKMMILFSKLYGLYHYPFEDNLEPVLVRLHNEGKGWGIVAIEAAWRRIRLCQP